MTRMGRPPKPAKERKKFVVCARLSREEFRKLSAEAERKGLSVSELARRKLSRGSKP